MVSKRKAAGPSGLNPSAKKKGKPAAAAPALTPQELEASFTQGLFEDAVEARYRESYRGSEPYQHAVITPLIADSLLLSVKREILSALAFTPKETDIYRIHQSGDLANISGLPAHLAAQLPSLRQLRDALYSPRFRDYVCAVTGCGALSGTKTDMAINVYTPGCHLLTHDDVIGSRRVSYILYLCGSPDAPWDPAWGGALRLYPTVLAPDGRTKVPLPEPSLVIPPAWNQLSFFEVVPGESFHDVQEVFDGPGDRTRMAISGWFHIPQPGEPGFQPGLEEELAKKSSLQSLQSKADAFDRPQPQVVPYPSATTTAAVTADAKGKGKAPEAADVDDDTFSTAELDFLLQYIAPVYLTPDTLDQMTSEFVENSLIKVPQFLCNKFAARLRAYVEAAEAPGAPASTWPVAVPPHKHKFLYLQPGESSAEQSPVEELLNTLLPSQPFRKLLQIATGMKVTSRNLLARRFRRGNDYTLATAMREDEDKKVKDKDGDDEDEEDDEGGPMQLEICLGVTPSKGWEDSSDDADADAADAATPTAGSVVTPGPSSSAAAAVTPPLTASPKASKKSKKAKPKPAVPAAAKFNDTERTLGGYELYLSHDDDATADAAIYKSASAGDDGDDGILFTNPASWNELSIVLRDAGTLRFVKYVSASAEGDRWDLVGEFGVEEGGELVSDGESSDEDGEGEEGEGGDEEEEEEEWAGIEEDGDGDEEMAE
ncbi:oxygenase-like protein [Geopyxis carbonaria]|nr:oxygenase-like protein [Geopyxis carbonaria]